MELRKYQHDAVKAVWQHLCGQPGNPVVNLPTGSGKSFVIARLVEEAVQKFCGTCMVLAHRKELLEQNAAKIELLVPDVEIGMYSAGLNSRETNSPCIVAGIQSVYARAHEFGKRNLVIVDEAHLVPSDGEGMYRQFLLELRTSNPDLRVVGMTATPFRLDCGPLCRPDGIFQKVCYSAPVQQLIFDGYLTNLTTKAAHSSVDTSKLRVTRGEFNGPEMAFAFGDIDLVKTACEEIIEKTRGRKSVLIFCAGVNHADHVAEYIKQMIDEECGVVVGETLPLERAATLDDFRSRRLRFLCNVDVLTMGFDSPCIDAIVILRATMSPGLFCQIVGRGFRVDANKTDCLILDFGENLRRHGPIDAVDYGRCHRTGETTGEAPTKVCPNCEIEVLISTTECECGFRFPARKITHETNADENSQVLSEPQTWHVESVDYRRHEKRNAQPGDPPTMRVIYTVLPEGAEGGNLEGETISEWVCFEHEGFAYKKARNWWIARSITAIPTTVDQAVALANRGALAQPTTITTMKEGQWERITHAELEAKPDEWLPEATVADDWDEVPF